MAIIEAPCSRPRTRIYLIFSVSGAAADTKVTADWYALDVAGVDPNSPALTYDTTVGDALGSSNGPRDGSVAWYEHLSPKSGGTLPVGPWKVVILLDGKRVTEQQFTFR